MGFASVLKSGEEIKVARETSLKMRGAAQANPTAKSAEIPVSAFLSIAELLETLAHRLEDPQPPQANAISPPSLDQDTLIDVLSAVPTMGGGDLRELLAPSEIREIADAVLGAFVLKSSAPLPKADDIEPDFLERLFKQYQ